MKKHWRVVITLTALTVPFALGLLITYEVIPYDWISMMEIQPSFRAMEDPLPLPEGSVPVQGDVSVRGVGSPENPLEISEDSLQRGQELYNIHCAICHGEDGKGQGSVSVFFQDNPPTDLTAKPLVIENDGAVFLTISNGVQGKMPALRANLDIEDRWHIVHYVQNLEK